jgi:hypothetical protein
MADFARDYAIGSEAHPTVMVPEAERDTFMGYVRAENGRSARATISASCRR